MHSDHGTVILLRESSVICQSTRPQRDIFLYSISGSYGLPALACWRFRWIGHTGEAL